MNDFSVIPMSNGQDVLPLADQWHLRSENRPFSLKESIKRCSDGLVGEDANPAIHAKEADAGALTPGAVDTAWMQLCRNAEDGDRDAQYEVAVRLLRRQEPHTEEAWRYLRRAADQGHPEACLAIGMRAEEPDQRKSYLETAAEAGLQEADLLLWGQTSGLAKTVGLLRTPEEQRGSVMLRLARRYRLGQLAEKSEVKALCWLQRAIEAGAENALERFHAEEAEEQPCREHPMYGTAPKERTPDEMNALGERCGEREEWAEAVSWFEKAAEMGHEGAQCNLAYCCMTGKGAAKDYSRAAALLTSVCIGSEADVLRAIAQEEGYTTTDENATAYDYYRSAAEAGNTFAQVNLGCLYYMGESIAQDHKEAVRWFREAAQWEENQQRNELGEYRDKLPGTGRGPIAPWFRRLARKARALAQNNLGACYLEGKGVEKDAHQAAELFLRSAEEGCEEGQKSLARCCANGTGVAQDWYEALRWYNRTADKAGRTLEALLLEEQGELNERALLTLSDRYYHGQGVERDLERAMALYRAAQRKTASEETERNIFAEL